MKRLIETSAMTLLLAAGLLPLLADSPGDGNVASLESIVEVKLLSPAAGENVGGTFSLEGLVNLFTINEYGDKIRDDFLMSDFRYMDFEIDCYVSGQQVVDAGADATPDSDGDGETDTITVEGLTKRVEVSAIDPSQPKTAEWILELSAEELNLAGYPAGTEITLLVLVSGSYTVVHDFHFTGSVNPLVLPLVYNPAE